MHTLQEELHFCSYLSRRTFCSNKINFATEQNSLFFADPSLIQLQVYSPVIIVFKICTFDWTEWWLNKNELKSISVFAIAVTLIKYTHHSELFFFPFFSFFSELPFRAPQRHPVQHLSQQTPHHWEIQLPLMPRPVMTSIVPLKWQKVNERRVQKPDIILIPFFCSKLKIVSYWRWRVRGRPENPYSSSAFPFFSN